jgi:hypothetical protein
MSESILPAAVSFAAAVLLCRQSDCGGCAGVASDRGERSTGVHDTPPGLLLEVHYAPHSGNRRVSVGPSRSSCGALWP